MTDNERIIEYDVDGKEYIRLEGAVAALLDADVVYVSGCDERCTLFVGFSDVFDWGSADGESLLRDEIETVYKAWKADPVWGIVKWAAVKRNLRPQWPMAKDMIAEGAWDDSMRALPPRTDSGDHGWQAAPAEYQ